MPAGRPTDYKPEYAEQAALMCLNGATDSDLAVEFKVSVTTIKTWRAKHPEFLASLKVNKEICDQEVEKSLYQRAVSGDTTAMIFWLKNRKPTEWRDRNQHEISGQLAVEYVAKSILDKGE